LYSFGDFFCFAINCHHLSVECLAIAPTGKSCPPLRQEMQEAFRPEQDRGEALHTFFLNDQKERKPLVHFLLNGQKKVNRKKSRRRCFIGQFFFYTNSVNLNTLKITPPSRNMDFSSGLPVQIQNPRWNPFQRGKLFFYVIAVNTLCL